MGSARLLVLRISHRAAEDLKTAVYKGEATYMTVRELAFLLFGFGIGWTAASALWMWWTPRERKVR